MISEIHAKEAMDIKNPAMDNYTKIKPETVRTTQEVNNFWKEEFKKASENAKSEIPNEAEVQEFKDDNGKAYREGNSLISNNEFEIRGYKYITDEEGRVSSAEGKLRMRDPGYVRDMEDVRKIEGQEYRESDDRGHLIGHQFDGSDRLENLVPMDAKLNQGDFVKLENTLADAVKDSADVRMKVEPVYEGTSTRPAEFRVTYSIDGDKDMVVFRNEREAQS